MLSLENISIQRDGHLILDGFELEVTPGRVLALAGPNGTGKSTALKISSGEWTPDSGSVTFNGRPLQEWSAEKLALHRAVLPQSSALPFPFKVWQVVDLGRIPHREKAGPDHERVVAEVMALCGLESLGNRFYATLSGGEQKRVHLARVIAQVWPSDGASLQGKYLLLDEPTASLDLGRQGEILGIVRDLSRRGAGVLVVMHDLNLAGQFSDQMILMRDGRQVAHGPPSEVLTEDHVHEAFGTRVRVVEHPENGSPLVVPIHFDSAKDVFDGVE